MKAKDISGFEDLLNEASDSAEGDWEINFVASIEAQYEEYGRETFISPKQKEMLERIAYDKGGR